MKPTSLDSTVYFLFGDTPTGGRGDGLQLEKVHCTASVAEYLKALTCNREAPDSNSSLRNNVCKQYTWLLPTFL